MRLGSTRWIHSPTGRTWYRRYLYECAGARSVAGELASCYADRKSWTEKAIRNVACSGRFSSDRTIGEYANEIWNLKVSPVFIEASAADETPAAAARGVNV